MIHFVMVLVPVIPKLEWEGTFRSLDIDQTEFKENFSEEILSSKSS